MLSFRHSLLWIAIVRPFFKARFSILGSFLAHMLIFVLHSNYTPIFGLDAKYSHIVGLIIFIRKILWLDTNYLTIYGLDAKFWLSFGCGF